MDVCFHVRDVRELYVDVALQAHKSTDGSLANSMFLPLAEKLMEKYVAEKKLDVEEGLLSPLSVFLHSSLSSFLILHTVYTRLIPFSFSCLVVNVVMLSQFGRCW